jgi:hypothetical protein
MNQNADGARDARAVMAIGALAQLRARADGHHALCARRDAMAIDKPARSGISQLAR